MGETPAGMVPGQAGGDGARLVVPASAVSNHFWIFFGLLSDHWTSIDNAGVGSGRCGPVGRVGPVWMRPGSMGMGPKMVQQGLAGDD